MVLAREFPVRLLDVLAGRVLRDAEDFVGVAIHSATITFAGRTTLVADPIAALDDLEHGAWLGAVAWLREHRLVDMRVERPVGLDLGKPLLAQRGPERLLDELHTLDEQCLLVPLGCLERPLEVVEDREKLADEPLVRMRDEPLLLTRGPLAVVLEVGLDALREVEVLVPLGSYGRESSSGVGASGSDASRLTVLASVSSSLTTSPLPLRR